jgi:Hemolysins and related proteins containing CBS domains
MPDPDRSTMLLVSCFTISFLFCSFLSASLRAENEKQRRTKTGFSAGALGALLASVFAGGAFCYRIFLLQVKPLFALLYFLLYLAFAVLLPYSVGLLFQPAFSRMPLSIIGYIASFIGNTIGFVVSLPAQVAVKLFGKDEEPVYTEEEILSAVDSAEEQDFIDETQKEMIANIFELDEITAGDAMTHRTDVTAIEENAPIIDAIRLSVEEGVSRIPVYRKTLDDIVGIVHVKDLFGLLDDEESRNEPAASFARPVMYTPETAKARTLLTEFKKRHTQIAIVVDEYGGTSGLVTMEDILEEIVGDMQDEFDDEEELIIKIDDNTYICDASADVEDLFELFELPVPEEYTDGDFETIGGLVIERLGIIPEIGEKPSVEFAGVLFTVKETAERRVLKVLCEKQPEKETPEDETI